MNIKPANRISEVKEYYFSVKLKELEQLRQQGHDIINLGIGNPDLPPAPKVIDALSAEAQKSNTHGYQSYIGIPELRENFAQWYNKYYNVGLNAQNEILPLIGSKEGIMHISMAFINPGDSVLVPNPGYPTYESVSKLVEANIITYNLYEELGWQPNLDELEKLDLSKVKLMWINYPNMPTGAKATKEFFKKIVAFGKKHNILICNDNPYSFILNEEPQSIFQTEGAKDTALELNSLSKSHNMAGWRIGMVAANKEIIQYILRVKSNMDSGMFRPMQVAASEALTLNNDWYTAVNSNYAERRELVWEIMDLLECSYSKDQVGMFVWAKIPAKYNDSGELSDFVLYNAHVFITPGFIFGEQGTQYIRISLCTKPETLKETLNRLKTIIK